MQKRTLGLVALLPLVITACASPSTTFQNSSGHTVKCESFGLGIGGSAAALMMHSSCVDRMKASGYFQVDEGSVAPKPFLSKSSLKIDLPESWIIQNLTEEMSRNGSLIYALNTKDDIGLLVSAASRKDIKDMMAYAISRRSDQEGRLLNPQATEIANMEINGHFAMRYEVAGYVKGGTKITYFCTIVEGVDQVVLINTWTTSHTINEKRSKLEEIPFKISGIT